jgi:hypothetical protein
LFLFVLSSVFLVEIARMWGLWAGMPFCFVRCLGILLWGRLPV